jgi:hypothetical protein
LASFKPLLAAQDCWSYHWLRAFHSLQVRLKLFSSDIAMDHIENCDSWKMENIYYFKEHGSKSTQWKYAKSKKW